MLNGMDSGLELAAALPPASLNLTLRNHGSCVYALINEMNSHPTLFNLGLEGTLNGIETSEFRKKRGMEY